VLSTGRGTKPKFEGFGFNGSMVIALIPDGVEVKEAWWASTAIDVARWNNWQMCLESFESLSLKCLEKKIRGFSELLFCFCVSI
jgi:hypothetical protein